MEVIYVSDGRTVDYYFNSLYRRRCFNPHKSLDSLRICLCGPVFNRVLDIFPGRYYQPGRNRHAGCHNADVSVNHQYGHPAVAKRAGAAVEDRGHLPRRNTALVTIPPLVGGIVSSLIMSQGASSAGLVDLSVFAILIYVMQGFAGYPLTAIMLQREGKTLLARYRSGEHRPDNIADEHAMLTVGEEKMPRLFSKIPVSYNSNYFKFLRLALVGCLAWLVADLAKPIVNISPFVLCLFFGVVFTSLGFLEKHMLHKANGFGFAIMALMLFIFDTLNKATPEMLLRLLFPMVVLIATAAIGMFVVSWLVGKLLGVSGPMAFAISLTALYGFPADYIITNEAINALTHDEKERQMLTHHMLGPMLVGGFVSVTMVSVVLAGILVGYLTPAVG